jgi:hypothetical protein
MMEVHMPAARAIEPVTATTHIRRSRVGSERGQKVRRAVAYRHTLN